MLVSVFLFFNDVIDAEWSKTVCSVKVIFATHDNSMMVFRCCFFSGMVLQGPY